MMNVVEKIVGTIRKRSREEWERIPRDAYAEGRSWIQANPERAAAGAFVVGIVLVLAFKLVFTVLFLGFAASLVVWQIALPEAEMPKTPPSPGGDGSGQSS
ncbi:MAG: hypothetical protein RL417_1899 [Pseudomonadota bacterium]